MDKATIITETHTTKSGKRCTFEYRDADSFSDLEYKKCRQVYGVSFYGEKMVIAFNGRKKTWGLLGGKIDPGETFEQTLAREVREESNMNVLSGLPIGYQKAVKPDDSFVYQLRYVCAVEPFGPFVSDPDGGIAEIKLIEPADYSKYFDWGKIGERLVTRALELKGKLVQE